MANADGVHLDENGHPLVRRVPEGSFEEALFRRLIDLEICQWPNSNGWVSDAQHDGVWDFELWPRAGSQSHLPTVGVVTLAGRAWIAERQSGRSDECLVVVHDVGGVARWDQRLEVDWAGVVGVPLRINGSGSFASDALRIEIAASTGKCCPRGHPLTFVTTHFGHCCCSNYWMRYEHLQKEELIPVSSPSIRELIREVEQRDRAIQRLVTEEVQQGQVPGSL